MNFLGIVCALTAFLNIWLGHVVVRFIEARSTSIRVPAAVFALAGILLETASFFSTSILVSAPLGISGVLLLWDAFEFMRQEKRVMKGHAPANSANPRHQHILATHPNASSIHWLKREPLGRPYTNAELEAIRREES